MKLQAARKVTLIEISIELSLSEDLLATYKLP
jgi:hypothetical protein